MNKYQEKALQYKNEGKTCSYSVYHAFKDEYKLNDEFPAPRSIEGRCGCLLVTEKILKDLGKEEKYREFEEKFIKQYGYEKCFDLIKNNGRRCSEYVEAAAGFLAEALKEE